MLDLQPGMLDKCARRLDAAGIGNYDTVLSDGATMPFDDESFDAVFLVTVFGEIADQEAFVSEAYRVLRPGGVLSITEHHPDPDFEPASAVAEAVARQGFRPAAPIGWRWAFTLNATKPTPGH